MQLEPLPSLADRFRSLLAAVKDACAIEGCRGLLAGPMALLFWICSRRMRQEAAAAFEQFKTLMEQLLVLLEDFRAGKLNGPDVRPAQQTIPAATMTDLSASGLDRRVELGDDDKELMRQLVEGIAPLRSSASSAANSLLRRKHRASQSPHEPVDKGMFPPPWRPKPSSNRWAARSALRSRIEYADPIHRESMHPRTPDPFEQAQSRFLDEIEQGANCKHIIPSS